jgi:hypothetical protein
MGKTKEAVFRLRISSGELARIKRVAKAKGEPASAWLRRLAEAEARREEAGIRVLSMLDEAKGSALSDDASLALAVEAQHEGRRRR